MCAALRGQGIEVLLTATDSGLADTFEARGTVITHRRVPLMLFPSQAGATFKYSRPYSIWLHQHVVDFDLVHIHAVFNHSSIAAARACRKHGVPYVVRPLGTLDPWSMDQKSLRKKMLWRLGLKRMLESANAIHYTTAGEQEAVERTLNLTKGFVAPLGVEVDEAYDATPATAFAAVSGHPYVLVISRLHPKKELDTLIEAFLAAVERPELSSWRLVIAGDGDTDYVDHLKAVARHNRPDAPVLFTGWLQGEAKESALRNAALVALISRQENFGLCIAEAMARNVSVMVSPQVNLAAEVERSGSGWVTPIDKEQITNALVEVMSNEGERKARGNAGRELAARHFGWEAIARQLAEVYASLITRPHTRTEMGLGTDTVPDDRSNAFRASSNLTEW